MQKRSSMPYNGGNGAFPILIPNFSNLNAKNAFQNSLGHMINKWQNSDSACEIPFSMSVSNPGEIS